jgi:serine phosphatase RsbU (regulator of sigma subunit)
MGNVDVLIESRPVYGVGGDFCDVVERDDGSLVAFLGDVSGKGVSAALVMARLMGEFGAQARAGQTPAGILSHVDRLMERWPLGERFVTATCVLLDAARTHWTVACAGHPAPRLRRQSGDTFYPAAAGMPLGLGIGEPVDFKEVQVRALPSDELILFSDGVAEALLGRDSEAIRLETAAANPDADANPDSKMNAKMESIRRRLISRLETAASDDATLVALKLAARFETSEWPTI